MDFILLDWTRMGRSYCLAGAVYQAGQYRIVRPLPARARDGAVPNQGWSPYLLDGHSRWEVFELIHPTPARAVAPHLEDVWVTALSTRHRLATPDERRAILHATLTPSAKSIFGTTLTHSPSGTTYAEPGCGERSLASVTTSSADVQFTALWREGAEQPDHRVSLVLPEGGRRILPVKCQDIQYDLHTIRNASAGGFYACVYGVVAITAGKTPPNSPDFRDCVPAVGNSVPCLTLPRLPRFREPISVEAGHATGLPSARVHQRTAIAGRGHSIATSFAPPDLRGWRRSKPHEQPVRESSASAVALSW